MAQSKKNTLILIQLDMRFCKFVNILEKIDIEAYAYIPKIAEPVFELAGIPDEKQTRDLREKYYTLIQENAEAMNVIDDDEVEERAEDIWKWIRANR